MTSLIRILVIGFLALFLGALVWGVFYQASTPIDRSLVSGPLRSHGTGQIDSAGIESKLKTCPRDPSAHYEMAILYYGRNEHQKAMSEMQTAIRLAPTDPYYRFTFGIFYSKAGDGKKALNEYLAAINLGEKHSANKEWLPMYHFYAANLYYDNASLEQAEDHYELALACLFAFSQEWAGSGMENRNSGNGLERQIRDASEERLKQIDTRLSENRKGMQVLWRNWHPQDYEEFSKEDALIELLAKLQNNPKADTDWFNLGWAYMCHGRTDSAIHAFNMAGKLGEPQAYDLAKEIQHRVKISKRP